MPEFRISKIEQQKRKQSCRITFTPMIERNLRIVFMGTPDFAVPSLQVLIDAGYPVVAVITAPDKPGGRGMKEMIVSPVKKVAQQHQIPVLQPTNLKSKEFVSQLRSLKADLQVVVAFRMLPEVVWNMPPLGTINLHGSLLPAYRGAAPIQWAVIRGETVTGLTTFRLQHEIDTGQIIHQLKVPVLKTDTAGTLHDRMMMAGAGLIIGTIDAIQSGEVQYLEQDNSKVSHAHKISHTDAHIIWNSSSYDVYNHIRGFSPYPGAWSILDNKELKILRAEVLSGQPTLKPGMLEKRGKKLVASTKDGELELLEVQLAGKKRMSAGDLLNGYQIKDWSLT